MSGISLDDVFSEQPADPEPTQVEPVVEQETGVEDAGTPPVEEKHDQQEDPIARKQKGLEAAAVAERQKRQAAEQRAQQLEAQLRELTQPKRPEAKPASNLVRPRRDEFDTVEEYEDALLEYGDQRREVKLQQERAQREAQEQQEHIARTANEVISKGQQAYADFDAVINAGIGDLLQRPEQKAEVFRVALLNGDRAHDVAYYLAKNPDEARRVYDMPPMQMVRAIALIEASKLETAQVEQPEPTAKPAIPRTLTTARDARGQFKPATYQGPTPLDDILATKKRA